MIGVARMLTMNGPLNLLRCTLVVADETRGVETSKWSVADVEVIPEEGTRLVIHRGVRVLLAAANSKMMSQARKIECDSLVVITRGPIKYKGERTLLGKLANRRKIVHIDASAGPLDLGIIVSCGDTITIDRPARGRG